MSPSAGRPARREPLRARADGEESGANGTDDLRVELHWPEGENPNGTTRPKVRTAKSKIGASDKRAASRDEKPEPSVAPPTALVTTLEALLEDIHSSIGTLRSELERLNARVDELGNDMSAVGEEVRALRRRLPARTTGARRDDAETAEAVAAIVVDRLLAIIDVAPNDP